MKLSNAHYRRLTIAVIFAIIGILRFERFLYTLDGALLFPPSSSSSSSRAARHKNPLSRPIETVAYAVSITSCQPKLTAGLFDAAAVLKRSIELNSWPLHPASRYASKFYAFTLKRDDGADPALVDRCYQILTLAGWEVIQEEKPVYPGLIKMPPGSSLRSGIRTDGCCGESELIKLATYKLVSHPLAVHLDLDTLIVNPLDELANVVYFGPETEEGRKARVQLAEVVAPTYVNRRLTGNPATFPPGRNAINATVELLANITVDGYFTKDYNMIVPGKTEQRVGAQGGFLAVRPSMTIYSHLISLVYSGEFYGGHNARNTGWFKSGYGNHIWGAMTIQGLMAYYFDVEQPDHSVELNKCRYNNIADNARISGFAKNPKFPRCTLLPFARNASDPRKNFYDRQCRDGRPSCDDTDCQRFPLKKGRVLHYTYCKSPWKCNGCDYLETYKEPTCYAMIREWMRVRSTLPGEGNRNLDLVTYNSTGPLAFYKDDGEVEVKEGNCMKEFYLGYCLDVKRYDGIKLRNFTASFDGEV